MRYRIVLATCMALPAIWIAADKLALSQSLPPSLDQGATSTVDKRSDGSLLTDDQVHRPFAIGRHIPEAITLASPAKTTDAQARPLSGAKASEPTAAQPTSLTQSVDPPTDGTTHLDLSSQSKSTSQTSGQAQTVPSPAAANGAVAATEQPALPSALNEASADTGQSRVDESALRYFARQGDTRRLEAEIARLRALYPDWRPPADPFNIPAIGDPDLDRMWTLYSQGRYAEVRQAIADRQKRESGWTPPKDLLERISVAENRAQLVNASNLQQYETVVRVATETPSLLTCSEVDVLWRLARAFFETDREPRTIDVYRYILTNCENQGERLATIQMALQYLPRPALDQLLALERKGTVGPGEFASARTDLARRSVSAAGDDASLMVNARDLEIVRGLADDAKDAANRTLLGWYYLKRDNFLAAEEWFRKSLQAETSSEASQGLALALISTKQSEEAEKVMRPYANDSEATRKVYVAVAANLLSIDPPIIQPTDVLQKIVDVVARLRDIGGARELGWYSYNLNQFTIAAQWFETTIGWKPDDEVAAFGLALVRNRLGDKNGLERLQRTWGGRSPRIAAVGTPTNGRPGVPGMSSDVVGDTPRQSSAAEVSPDTSSADNAPSFAGEVSAQRTPAKPRERPRSHHLSRIAGRSEHRNDDRSCLQALDPRTLSPQAALNRGWCLMGLNRPVVAAPAFEVALLSSSTQIRQDAAYGQSLAYIKAGLTDQAAVSAAKQPQSSARRVELATALLSAQAVESFKAKRPVETLQALEERSRIAPERIDLMILRGYAYLELGRYGDAERVFTAAAAAGSREGAKGLNTLREATGYFQSSD